MKMKRIGSILNLVISLDIRHHLLQLISKYTKNIYLNSKRQHKQASICNTIFFSWFSFKSDNIYKISFANLKGHRSQH